MVSKLDAQPIIKSHINSLPCERNMMQYKCLKILSMQVQHNKTRLDIRQNKTKSKIEAAPVFDYGQCFIHIPKQVCNLTSILEVSKVFRFLLFKKNHFYDNKLCNASACNKASPLVVTVKQVSVILVQFLFLFDFKNLQPLRNTGLMHPFIVFAALWL